MIFELRTYRIKPGCRNAWVDLMDRVIIPFQQQMGMTVIGSFINLEDEDEYIWIRRFDDEARRKQLYDAVYGSPRWKNEIRPAMADMLIREKVAVKRLQATLGSALQ